MGVATDAFVADYLAHFREVMCQPELEGWLAEARDVFSAVRDGEGKLIFAGNGASPSR